MTDGFPLGLGPDKTFGRLRKVIHSHGVKRAELRCTCGLTFATYTEWADHVRNAIADFERAE